MALMLLERGADPNVHVYASGPSVHRAFHRKDWAMMELLKRYGSGALRSDGRAVREGLRWQSCCWSGAPTQWKQTPSSGRRHSRGRKR